MRMHRRLVPRLHRLRTGRRPMNIYAAGSETLVRMALDGELSPSVAWVAIKGAEKYRRAVASGDIASAIVAKTRANKCVDCPSSTVRDVGARGMIARYCGPAFQELDTTCGCLVSLTVGGSEEAAGKTVVESEHCTQRKW